MRTPLPFSAVRRAVRATAAVAGAALCLASQAAVVYDAAADFSGTNGGASVWSYGWDPADATSTYSFQALDLYAATSAYKTWNASTHSFAGTPGIWLNLGAAQFGIATGQVSLHPAEDELNAAPNDNAAILRFTAPTAGAYTVDAKFFNGDGGETEAWVVLNGNFAAAAALGITSVDPTYAQVLTLGAGDTVDFVVGNASDNLWADNTGVAVSILGPGTTTVPVPEPGSVGLLALGGLALAAQRRRRGC